MSKKSLLLCLPLCESSKTVIESEGNILPEVIKGEVVDGRGKCLVVFWGESSEPHTQGISSLQYHLLPSKHLTPSTVGGEEAPGAVVTL